ncbi:hypothetical protein CDL15_Pgr024867 [Punica granatum]|uniref:Uncharacterized protein n=1 Tax=Punica granatum TaxID=22663 RepID=A0A218Y2P1_PUNGR|nr:hypothetical protein CDL15_Pgr024867 [Punica granatum]
MGARTTKEKQESLEKHRRAIGRMNEQQTPKTAEAKHYGTIHYRINGASEGIQYEILKIPLGAKMTNGTSGHTSEVPCLSRGTPEHSQTPS